MLATRQRAVWNAFLQFSISTNERPGYQIDTLACGAKWLGYLRKCAWPQAEACLCSYELLAVVWEAFLQSSISINERPGYQIGTPAPGAKWLVYLGKCAWPHAAACLCSGELLAEVWRAFLPFSISIDERPGYQIDTLAFGAKRLGYLRACASKVQFVVPAAFGH